LEADIALHFNPRMGSKQRVVVLNDKKNGEWMVEERYTTAF